jgi:hypothetical protein
VKAGQGRIDSGLRVQLRTLPRGEAFRKVVVTGGVGTGRSGESSGDAECLANSRGALLRRAPRTTFGVSEWKSSDTVHSDLRAPRQSSTNRFRIACGEVACLLRSSAALCLVNATGIRALAFPRGTRLGMSETALREWLNRERLPPYDLRTSGT